VHKRFTVEDVRAARERYPGATVIVHPECDRAVVEASDLNGSTEYIYKTVAAAGAGSAWIIGTEGSFVERLAASFPEKKVVPLRVSICFNMARIDLTNLASTLRSIRDRTNGNPLLFPVEVAAAQKQHAEMALKMMIEITESAS
jgi:quinolinate synthase